MLSVKVELPLSTIIIVQFLVLPQSFIIICQSGQLRNKDITSTSTFGGKDSYGLSKFDCHTCKITTNIFSENLLVLQTKDNGSKDYKSLLASAQKRTCQFLSSDYDKEQCHLFLDDHQSEIDEWLRLHSNKNVRMFDHICVNKLKLCCLAYKFGPSCKDCPKCPKNMICDGDGTRTGNGTCLCQAGFHNENCSDCSPGYYREITKDSDILNCLKCHRSCRFCRAGGSQGCEVCDTGFHWDDNYGCIDIDECIREDGQICGSNTFCVNTEGSYFCYECDRACDGCNGDGPDMCLRCAKNYIMNKGACHAKQMTIIPPEANYYRYAIYFGLALCTCIILPYSLTMASLVGLAASLYIGLSEYTLTNNLHAGDFSIDSRTQF